MGAGNCGCSCHEQELNSDNSNSDSDIFFPAEEDLTTCDAPKKATNQQATTEQDASYDFVKEVVSMGRWEKYLGRFFWLREPYGQYFDIGLSEVASAHPFVVVDVEVKNEGQGNMSKVSFGLSMIQAFSKSSCEGKARELASRGHSLVPIFPNAQNPESVPQIAFLKRMDQETPQDSWIRVSTIYYVREEQLNLERKGLWSKLQLHLASVNAIRQELLLSRVGDSEFTRVQMQQFVAAQATVQSINTTTQPRREQSPAEYKARMDNQRLQWAKGTQDHPELLLVHLMRIIASQ
ncbi:hypothetical protein LTR84_004150 [Exophiala bonariae]|uniref:Uncharacterized protein n=1 Tax=Exophiala bonariae TaxID=1690606 RepID=A0AAV9N5F5_9EURO|nr:hypothetical protein LTR84_004150 [Exophiala bonariae]